MKVAVFGGSGFLGSYIVNELSRRDYDVVSFDIHPPSYESEIPFIQIDILDQENLDKQFLKHQFDIVYNLAGFANLDKAIHYPHRAFELNVLGNINILDCCKNYNITQFIYASSAYAVSDKGSFYGISKLTSEKIVEEYNKRYNLNFSILRYGSVYSDKCFDNNYIYNLIEEAIKTKTINHSGDGQEVREYIHAEDAAKLSVDVIENNELLNTHLLLTGVERLKRYELFDMVNEILNGQVSINLREDGYINHYKLTPYSFSPENNLKLTPNPYIDMGQGVLNCVKSVYKKLQ